MPGKIPATVITGFLGAGKTTLIRNLLAQNGGKRIALVINEFGDIGVDGEVLRGCGDALCAEDDIIELSNGCICCTVADDFVPTMKQLLDRPAPPTTSSSRPPASPCRNPWCGPSTGRRSAPG
jgi:cobalamin biosynthesis protein CobW